MGNSVERLLTSLMFSMTAAEFANDAGYPEDAARECMFTLELIGRVLSWMRMNTVLSKKFKQNYTLPFESAKTHDLAAYLGDLALHCAKRYEELTTISWTHATQSDSPRLGREITPEAVHLLGGVICALNGLGKEQEHKTDDLRMLFESWAKNGRTDEADSGVEKAIDCVRKRHLYPALGQLSALKMLVDEYALQAIERQDGGDHSQIKDLLNEMQELCERLDAPLHFTPGSRGESMALVALAMKESDPEKESLIRAAITMLTTSQQSYTMGRAYYQSISGLQYLHDDFNDRRIHANHASQMAGAEMHLTLKGLLKSKSKRVILKS